jgi:hypothetical protein
MSSGVPADSMAVGDRGRREPGKNQEHERNDRVRARGELRALIEFGLARILA